MASTYSDLKVELIGTGEQTGTWGTTTNNNFSVALGEAITGSADVIFSGSDVTLTLTDTNAAQTARNLRLNLTGTSGGARNLILGSGCQIDKLYLINNGLADAVTVKNTTGTGVAVPAGASMFVFNNGTNVTETVSNISSLTAPLVIEGTTTSAALRITQLGTGNALLVEDSANPDSSPFVIDASGQTIQGYTTALATQDALGNSITPKFQQQGASASQGAIGSFMWSASTAIKPLLVFSRSKSSTIGTPGAVSLADDLGAIVFNGDDGTNFIPAAQILSEVDGTPSTNDMPGRLVFSTTADGASTPTERMRIDSAGDVGIGTTSPLTRLEIAGSNSSTWSVTASITGTTMDVTSVGAGTLAVGDLVHGTNVQPYTRITSFISGSGGAGTYEVSVSQTLSSGTVVGGPTYGNTLIRLTDTDTAVGVQQPVGGLQFYTSDASTPTAGVGAYIAGVSESTTPDTALVFGTRDNAGGGVDANERMRITSTGNVGIGNTNPAAKLQVTSPNATNTIFDFSEDGGGFGPLVAIRRNSASPAANDGLGYILFQGQDSVGTNTNYAGIYSRISSPTDGAEAGILAFYTTDAGTIAERMRIDSSGNVAIGTTSTGFNASGLPLVVGSGSGNTGLTIYSGTAASGSIHFADGTTSTDSYRGIVAYSHTSNYMTFWTDATESMRIDSSGNVGIGTSSPAYKLDVYDATTAYSRLVGDLNTQLIVQRSSTDTSGALQQFYKTRGTVASPTIVADGDITGRIVFYGYDGAGFGPTAEIRSVVEGTPGTNDMPGRLVFYTTADGSSTTTERLRIDSQGRMDMRSSMTETGNSTASSISGTTLTLGGTVSGVFNVGDRIFGTIVEPNTFITAFLSGTPNTAGATYSVSNSQTTASGPMRAVGGGLNVFRFTDTDVSVNAAQPMGVIEWYGSDSSTPGAGVKAYITAIPESTSPDTALVFGTSDNVASTQAVERWRIDSTGVLTAKSGSGLSISATGVTSPASTDGNVFSGTYTPTLFNTTNVAASTAAVCQYMRVGNVVTVSGSLEIDPTAANTDTILGMSIPVASNFGGSTNAGGTFVEQSIQIDVYGCIYADSTNDRLSFRCYPSDAGNRTYHFTVTYRIV